MVINFPLKTEFCRQLLTYWDKLRDGRLLPRRSEIDPGALKPLLPYISILELRAPDVMVYRLHGTALRDIMGMDATNRNLLDFTPIEGLRLRAYRLWSAATVPCGSTYEIDLSYARGAKNAHEGLSLPIEPVREGAPPLLLGIFAPLQGTHWAADTDAPRVDIGYSHSFIDIGADVPTALTPPDDFLPDALRGT